MATLTKSRKRKETLTEAYEVRAFRDESEQPVMFEPAPLNIPHPEPRSLELVKTIPKGHGEQTVLPDDCEFADNDLCYVEA